MTKLEITKRVASAIVGIGTGKIAATVIKNNHPSGGIVTQITVIAASVVIGMMASDATSAYTNTKIDEAVALWNKIRHDEAVVVI